MLTDVVRAHLEAAESEGRSLTDHEAALIEAVASSVEPVVASTPYIPAPPVDAAAERRELLSAALEAVQSRSAFRATITASTPVHYSTTRVAGEPAPVGGRLVEQLRSMGAADLGSTARTFQVPRVKSGDAAEWIPGQAKSEIVTELGTVSSDVIAAFTAVTSTGFMDISSLDAILAGLLSRRVVVQENAAVAASILAQGPTPLDGLDDGHTVATAVTDAMLGGADALVLLLGGNVAATILGDGGVGPFGRDADYRSSLIGHPFIVVPGMNSDTVVAVDPRAVAVAFTPLQLLVDPYSGSTSNEVVIRVESSVAAVVTDSTGVGVAAKSGT